MSSRTGWLPFDWRAERDEWINKRYPVAQQTTLDIKKILIIPGKTSFGLLLTCMVLFLFGVNFQNSLIYAICFWLIALLLVNIFYTYRNLAGITVRAVAIEPCFAGSKAVLELEISRPEGQKKSAVMLGWKGEDQQEINLSDNQSVRVKLTHSVMRRGRFKPPRVDIFTRFPTGLAMAWSYASLDIEGLVYPEPLEFNHSASGINSGEASEEGVEIARGSTDFGGIRDYQHSDSPRHIHWGKFAQTGELYTKSFVDYESADLWLEWDNLTVQGVENRLSYLCSKVLEFDREQKQYGLKIPGALIQPASGANHKTRCLTALALFNLAGASC